MAKQLNDTTELKALYAAAQMATLMAMRNKTIKGPITEDSTKEGIAWKEAVMKRHNLETTEEFHKFVSECIDEELKEERKKYVEDKKAYYDANNFIDEDMFENLEEEDKIKLQEKLGRTRLLICETVSMHDECDMCYFLDERLPNFIYELIDYNEEDCEEDEDYDFHNDTGFGNLYIYATKEEAKKFIEELKKDPFIDKWFGKHYKFINY